jgi:hypothetical protein
MKTGGVVPTFVPSAPIALPTEQAVIVNIAQIPFAAERTYGCYRIEGCTKGEPFVSLAISAARGIIHRGDLTMGKNPVVEQFPIKAEDIAVDLVRQWNSDLWGIGSTVTGVVAEEQVRGFAGVFVAEGMTPTAEELAQAHEILALSDKALFERAQSEWDQFHRPDMIHAGWKRSARRLGVDVDWLYVISNMAALPDCQFCGSKMKTMTATVCATCHREQNPAVTQPIPAVPRAKKQREQRKAL